MKKVFKAIGIFIVFLGITLGVLWAVFFGFKKPTVPISQPDGVEYKIDTRRTNILILGTDNRNKEVSRTDTIMLASIDNELKVVSIVSIPRDTRVDLPGIGLTKINHANAVGQKEGGIHQGTVMISNAVSNLLGVNVDHYVKVDFKGFKKLVDLMGGVEADIPYDINDVKSKAHLKAGKQILNGDQALSLARARYTRPNGDFDRQESQFMLISALGRKMTDISNITNLPGQLDMIFSELLDTSITKTEVIALGLNLKGIQKKDIRYYQLPGNGIKAFDPLEKMMLYYYEPDKEGVKLIMEKVFNPNAAPKPLSTTGDVDAKNTVDDSASSGVNP